MSPQRALGRRWRSGWPPAALKARHSNNWPLRVRRRQRGRSARCLALRRAGPMQWPSGGGPPIYVQLMSIAVGRRRRCLRRSERAHNTAPRAATVTWLARSHIVHGCSGCARSRPSHSQRERARERAQKMPVAQAARFVALCATGTHSPCTVPRLCQCPCPCPTSRRPDRHIVGRGVLCANNANAAEPNRLCVRSQTRSGRLPTNKARRSSSARKGPRKGAEEERAVIIITVIIALCYWPAAMRARCGPKEQRRFARRHAHSSGVVEAARPLVLRHRSRSYKRHQLQQYRPPAAQIMSS